MKKDTKNAKKSTAKKLPCKTQEYAAFIEWMSLPGKIRVPKNQTLFAAKFGLCPQTLSGWKQTTDFWRAVAAAAQWWGQERTPNVVLKLYDRIMKTGDATSIRIWLEHFGGLKTKIEITPEPTDEYAWLKNMSDAELDAHLQKQMKTLRLLAGDE